MLGGVEEKDCGDCVGSSSIPFRAVEGAVEM